MIKLTDACLLAFTKLRARKLRTGITILLASLLFGVVITASLVTNGLVASINSFRKEGLTSRYIVSVFNAPGKVDEFYNTIREPMLIAEAKQRYEALIKEKEAAAKQLNITYSHISDTPPYTQSPDGTTRLSMHDPNGITWQLLKEKYSHTPAFDEAKLSKIAAQYSAINRFTEEIYHIKRDASLTLLVDGREHFYDASDESTLTQKYTSLINPTSIVIAPRETTETVILPKNAGWQPDGSSLPIILPQNVIEQLLKLEKLPSNVSPHDKFERLKTIRNRITSLQFKMCYRNSVSQSLLQQALQQKKEIGHNQGKKDYKKPTLLYELPDPTTCENARIASDLRTPAEKQQAANQAAFDAKFGKEITAISKLITFKVVGMSPGSNEVFNPEQLQQREKSRTASDMLADILQTEGVGQAIPKHLYDQLPNKAEYAELLHYKPFYIAGNEDNKRRFLEFASASDAQKFIDEQGCTVQYDNSCKPLGHPYQLRLAFSNSSALDDLQATIHTWFAYVMIGVATIASLITWIAVGRTIVDGRHETAVFRAIGFKRIDIAAVYILYTIALSTLITLLASVIGFTGSYLLQQQFAPQLTAQAQYGFGAIHSTNSVYLIGVNVQQLVIILGICIATSLLSTILPLIRNVRRSPIRDMRGE